MDGWNAQRDRPRNEAGGREDEHRAPLSRIVSGLEALAKEAGIEIRIEPFERTLAGKGGLCRIGNHRVILVDARMAVLEQIGVIGEALGRVLANGTPPNGGHESTPVPPPQIAPELVPYLRTGHGKVGRLLRPRPLARAR